MSPRTSQRVSRRAHDRRTVALRQAELDAKERDRKNREVDLAVAFMKVDARRQEALKEVADAEARLGTVVDELIRLGSTYQRCAVLVELPQDELRRLRALARHDDQHHGGDGSAGGRRADAEKAATAGKRMAGGDGGGGRREPAAAVGSQSRALGQHASASRPNPAGMSDAVNT